MDKILMIDDDKELCAIVSQVVVRTCPKPSNLRYIIIFGSKHQNRKAAQLSDLLRI